MRRIIILMFVVLAFLVTGCGSSNGTIICKSEAHGTDPTIVNYEKYVVEDNKIIEYTKYNTIKFTDDYIAKYSIDNIFEIYQNDPEITVEKVDGNTLKTIAINPKNYYADIESNNMLETIRSLVEGNEFNVYSYTCETK